MSILTRLWTGVGGVGVGILGCDWWVKLKLFHNSWNVPILFRCLKMVDCKYGSRLRRSFCFNSKACSLYGNWRWVLTMCVCCWHFNVQGITGWRSQKICIEAWRKRMDTSKCVSLGHNFIEEHGHSKHWLLPSCTLHSRQTLQHLSPPEPSLLEQPRLRRS